MDSDDVITIDRLKAQQADNYLQASSCDAEKLHHQSGELEKPRSQVIEDRSSKPKSTSESLTKLRPKLPLYSSVSNDLLQQTKNVTVDEILKSVRALDEQSLHKPVIKATSLDKFCCLKTLRPCSSLLSEDGKQDSYTDADLNDLSSWDIDGHLKRQEVARTGDCSSSLMDGDKQCPGTEEPNSQRFVPFKSLLGSETEFDSTKCWKDPSSKKDCTKVTESFSVVAAEGNSSCQERKTDRYRAVASCSNKTPVEKAIGTVSCIHQSQFCYEQEACAASSVLDVSDFLTCVKKQCSSDSAKFFTDGACSVKLDNSLMKVPAVLNEDCEPVDGTLVAPKHIQHASLVQESLEVQPSLAKNLCTKKEPELRPSGFSTAGGKDIDVSAKSLAFVSQMFEKVEKDLNLKANIDIPATPQDSLDVQPSFTEDEDSIASKVQIPEEIVPLESENTEPEGACSPILFQHEYKSGLSVLSEPSSPVLMESSISLVEERMQEVNVSVECPKICEENFASNVRVETCQSKLPSASSNSPCVPGERSIDVSSSSSSYSQRDNLFEPSNPIVDTLPAFGTASGKPMTISQESLEKARQMFDQCGSSSAGRTGGQQQHSSVLGSISSFTTAGGKHMKISRQSITKARNFYEQCSNDSFNPPSSNSMSTTPRKIDKRKSLFNTASGKIMKISSENLRRAKKMFDSCGASEEDDPCIPLPEVNEESKAFAVGTNTSGCKTARGQVGEFLDSDSEIFQTVETPPKQLAKNSVIGFQDGLSSQPCAEPHSPVLFKSVGGLAEPSIDGVHCDSQNAFNETGVITQENVGDRCSPTILKSLKEVPQDFSQHPSTVLNLALANINAPPDGGGSPSRAVSVSNSSKSSLNKRLNTPKECADCGSSPLKTALGGLRIPTVGADRCTSPILMSSAQAGFNPPVSMVGILNASHTSQDVPNGLNFVSAAGKKVQPSQSSFAKIKGLVADIFDEEDTCFLETTYGLNPCEGNDPYRKVFEGSQSKCFSHDDAVEPKLDLRGCRDEGVSVGKELKDQNSPIHSSSKTTVEGISTFKSDMEVSFKSAGGKNVVPTAQGLKRMKALFAELCDSDVSLENFDHTTSESTITGSKDLPEPNRLPDRPRSPVLLNCSFVEVEDGEIEKPNELTPATITVQKDSGSLEWEEFPDLKASQADLLEADASHVHVKENTSHLANKNPLVGNRKSWKTEVANLCGVKPANTQNTGAATRRLPAILEDEALGKRKSPDSLEGHRKKVRHSLDFNVNLKADSKTAPSILGILHSRRHLRDRQKALIQAKMNQKVTPSLGILSAKKSAPSRLKLKDLDNQLKMVDPGNMAETSIQQCVFGVSSENALYFRFRESAKIVDGDTIADACLFVYADDGTAGVDEVCSAFLTCPNVDPKLVPDGWVKNHYRWIVWKLAAFERTFPQHFGGRCLTLETVLLQLKYRYDREVDMVQRSAFKKILEGDAAPSKFICCIASVKQNNLDEGESLLEFELTDGWYSIWSIVDSEMVTLYKKQVVSPGTKLIVHGAEITNCDQGCDPLSVPACVKAKISTNSVRRAKWFAKMGFDGKNTPIPSLLCSVLPNGGLIGHLTAVVVRKYPIIYMCKDADGKTVFRSERSQAIYQELQEKTKTDKAEQVYDQVWKEVESKYQRSKLPKKYSAKEIKSLTDPEVLFSIVDGADGEFIQSQLSADQLRMVLNYKSDVMAKMKSEVQKSLYDKLSESVPASKVTKLLKVRLMDLFTEKHALLTIWRPSDDDLGFLREDKAFEFYNLMASGTRDKVLQLSSHRQTTYEPNDVVEPSSDFRRALTPLNAFEQPGFTPHFGEVDTVGVVVLVKLPEQTRGVTVVYLSDLDGHYVSVTFWTSLSVFGCGDLMTEGSLVACSNLQWRSVSNQRKIPSVFASEMTSFSLNPKQHHLRLGIAQLRTRLFDKDTAEMVASARSFVIQSMKLRDFSASTSPSPLTPKSSTPAAQKMKILRRYDEAPISPLPPLTVTTRHVFQNFKSPCTTPQRRKLT